VPIYEPGIEELVWRGVRAESMRLKGNIPWSCQTRLLVDQEEARVLRPSFLVSGGGESTWMRRPLCEKPLPSGIAWSWDSGYGAFIASLPDKLAGMRIRVRCEKGKPVVRRGRKA
jgi:hypothetical protein